MCFQLGCTGYTGLDLSQVDMTPSETVLVHTLYLKHNTHGDLHFELDHPLRSKRPLSKEGGAAGTADHNAGHGAAHGDGSYKGGDIGGLTPAEADLYATLQRDGILKVEDFGQ